MCYAHGKLVAVGTRNQGQGKKGTVHYEVHAYDVRNGLPKWRVSQNQREKTGGSHGEQDHHPVLVGQTVYVEPYAYDLQSGARRTDWLLRRGGHGCGTMSASAKSFFFRADNPTMCDLASGMKTKVTRVSRPGCWINMIPAGGLLLIPEASSGCVCDFPIQTSMGFAPE